MNLGSHRGLLVAAATAGLLSFGLGVAAPRHAAALQSDARWYYDVADDIATGGLAYAVSQPQPSVSGNSFAQRPPGHPLLVAGVFHMAGSSPRARYLTLLFVLSALAAGSALIVGGLCRANGVSPKGSVYIAAAFAVAPTTVWFPRTQLSESTATFLLLLFLLAATRAARSPTWSAIAVAAVAGAACLHTRIDLGPVVCAFPLALALQVRRSTAAQTRPTAVTARLALVALFAVLLCVPWTLWISRHVGHFVAVAEGPAPTGFSNFQTTLALPPEAYMRGYVDFESGRLGKALRDIPDRAWGSDRRHFAEIKAIAAATETATAPPNSEVRATLATIAAARIRASPARHYLALPAYRTAVMWTGYHQAQTEQERRVDFSSPRAAVRTLWNAPYSLLVVWGALGSLVLLARPGNLLFPLASVVIVRTATLTGLSTVGGYSHVLPRYLVPVYGIAVLIALSSLCAREPAPTP